MKQKKNIFENLKIKVMIEKSKLKKGLIPMIFCLIILGCDLEIEETDSLITAETTGFGGVEDPPAQVDDLYNSINGQLGDQANFFALNEVTTDELLVPTRGTDWGDNGVWRTLHAHTWTASHQYVLNVWNNLNQNVFRATEVIHPLSNASDAAIADAKFVRAFSMFWVMDLYGQVPFREATEDASVDPRVLTRAEAYDFVLQDINDAIDGLPEITPGSTGDRNNSRGSKAAAQFLKAKLLLNSGIYLGTPEPTNTALTEVIELVDKINAQGYNLQSGYFELFEETSDNETIYWVQTSVGNRIWNGLHYNQISPDNGGGGWNGFTTLAEFYDLFEGPANSNPIGGTQEERRGFVPKQTEADETNVGIGYGFLIGQQVGATGFNEDGTAKEFVNLNDRAGNPLIFTKELPGLIGNNERTGIRVIKYHPAKGSFTGHEIVFRYADAHLMKAEANFRSGNTAEALTAINELRKLRNATELNSITEADILAERGRELYIEFWRRNDLIRFGQFTKTWEFKSESAVNDETKHLFPIPSVALLSNPNLQQNEGY